MSNLNHQRPHLKYLDNINRELNTMYVISKPNKEIDNANVKSCNKSRCHSLKGQYLWKKMNQIELSENEFSEISNMLELINKHIACESELIEKLSKNQKNTKTIKEKQILVFESIVSTAVKLISSELVAQSGGRRKGVFDWFNLLGKYLYTNGLEDTWEFLTDSVFTRAFGTIGDIPEWYQQIMLRSSAQPATPGTTPNFPSPFSAIG